MRIGVIGCGMVSHAYCGTIARVDGLDLAALASRTMRSAEVRAAQYGGRAMTVEALLADASIGLVVVLAPPALHHPLGLRVLDAGKHLYLEKPLATSLPDADQLLGTAAARRLMIGCAPDTFLGAGHRRTRELLADKAIGTVVGGTATFASAGVDGWHPSPAAFYADGGGPLLDIGPYYLTRLVDLLGPVASVTATGSTPRRTRTARDGSTIVVSVPTSVVAALRFRSGPLVSLSLSWDTPHRAAAPIELRGSAGVLHAPDPNGFDGETRWSVDGIDWAASGPARSSTSWDDATLARAVDTLAAGVDPVSGGPVGPETPARLGDRRGAGVVEMVAAIAAGRPPRASGALAYHVLEVLLGAARSIDTGATIDIVSRLPTDARSLTT